MLPGAAATGNYSSVTCGHRHTWSAFLFSVRLLTPVRSLWRPDNSVICFGYKSFTGSYTVAFVSPYSPEASTVVTAYDLPDRSSFLDCLPPVDCKFPDGTAAAPIYLPQGATVNCAICPRRFDIHTPIVARSLDYQLNFTNLGPVKPFSVVTLSSVAAVGSILTFNIRAASNATTGDVRKLTLLLASDLFNPVVIVMFNVSVGPDSTSSFSCRDPQSLALNTQVSCWSARTLQFVFQVVNGQLVCNIAARRAGLPVCVFPTAFTPAADSSEALITYTPSPFHCKLELQFNLRVPSTSGALLVSDGVSPDVTVLVSDKADPTTAISCLHTYAEVGPPVNCVIRPQKASKAIYAFANEFNVDVAGIVSWTLPRPPNGQPAQEIPFSFSITQSQLNLHINRSIAAGTGAFSGSPRVHECCCRSYCLHHHHSINSPAHLASAAADDTRCRHGA